MSDTIHKNNNPFSTLALRGGRLRKRGRGVVSYAPFLMGASAVVLGSMFMLSALPFANASNEHNEDSSNTCEDSTLNTAVRTTTEITTTATVAPKHTRAVGGQDVTDTINDTYHDDDDYSHVDVIVTPTGVYNTTFTTSGSINGSASEYYAGVFLSRSGNGALCLVNGADIRDTENYGIEASRSGEGVLDISNGGNITNAGNVGIKAYRSGDDDLKISSTGNIGANKGIYARHSSGGGSVKINLEEAASVTAEGGATTDHGIQVKHNGSGEVGVYVLSERVEGSEIKNVESTHGTGIRVEHIGGGNVAVKTDGWVWGKKSGVWVEQNRTGSVELLVREGSWIHGDEQHGLFVNHIGGGSIDIDVQGGSGNTQEGVTSRTDDAIKVINTGDNLTKIDIDGRVSSTVSSASSDTSGKGIYAKHNGAGNIDIDLLGDGKVLSRDDDGIYAKHSGNGQVLITLKGSSAVRSTGNGSHGVNVHHSGSGLVGIDILELVAGSTTRNIESSRGDGIHIERTGNGAGNVAVGIDGRVWGKESGVWVEQNRTGSVTLSVREGSWMHGDEQHGLHVNHIGGGTIDIDVQGGSGNTQEGVTSRTGDAIKVINTGDNLTKIDIDGRVSSTVSSASSDTSGRGVYAKHDGAGHIDIDLLGDGKVLSSDDDGIYAKHSGNGQVLITLQGSSAVGTTNTRTGNTVTDKHGVNVYHSGSGLVDIDILSERVAGSTERNIESTHGDGIHIKRVGSGGGNVAVETDGWVWGEKSGVWVEQNRTGSVEFLVRDGSRMYGEEQYGLFVNHIAGGSIDIDVQGGGVTQGSVMSRNGDAIKVINTGDNLTKIDINGGRVFSTGYGSAKSGKGIYAKHNGAGNIDIDLLNRGEVRSNDDDGIYAKHEDEGDIRISLQNHARINSPFDNGIYAKHTSSGDIVLSFEGKPIIRTGSTGTPINVLDQHGIELHHSGSGLVDININTQPFGVAPVGFRRSRPRNVYSYRGDGVHIQRSATSSGNVNVVTNGPIWGRNHGILIDHKGTGDVKVEVLNGSRVFADRSEAISVISKGLIDIDVKGGTGEFDGVEGWATDAIFVHSTGSELIDIDIAGRVTTLRGSAIHALQTSGEDIEIDVKSGARLISRDNSGITARTTGGDISVAIEDGGAVRSNKFVGISVESEGGGTIEIDLAGRVFNGNDDNDFAIQMHSRNTKTLILRPSFEMDGEVFSFGGGKGILKLNQHAVNASREGTLDLDKFNHFNEFVKEDENIWVLTGSRAEGDGPLSSFRKAKVVAGTLRFKNVNFAMAPGRRQRFFEVLDDSVLGVVGTNTLKGNLKNSGRGEIFFDRGGNLKVNGNYKGLGSLVFDIGTDARGWDNLQKLLITGNIVGGELVRPVFIRYSGSVALGGDDSPWLVLEKNEEEEGEDHFDIGGVMFGEDINGTLLSTNSEGEKQITIGTNVYEFEHDHINVQGENGETFKANGWRLDRVGSNAPGAPRLPDPNRGEDDPRINRDGRETNALRDDTLGHAGGVWAEQGSSRTLQESGAISGGHLRTESDHVRFGFDLPAQGFMGGDVVLGAGVRQEFSVSDFSSPSGRSTIGVESHAALLKASWWSPAGFYADGQAQYVRFSRGISTDGLRDQAHEGTGMGISSELGYRFAVPFGGMDFEIVPQMQLAWSRVGFEDYVTSRGGLISLEDGELMKGRLGLSWDGEWRDAGGFGRIYGGVNLRDALDGRTAVRATGVLLTSKQGSSVDGRLGLSYEWDDGYSIYGEAKALRSGDVEEVSANLGVNIDF